MTKGSVTTFATAALTTVAAGVFVFLSGLLSAPVKAETGCTPGECQKNGCSEKAQYCGSDGTYWEACGTC